MQLSYDYIKDTVSTQGVEYELSDIRKWLTQNYSELVMSHFIKVIKSDGKNKPTFDWYNIYQTAEDMGLMHEYFMNYDRKKSSN